MTTEYSSFDAIISKHYKDIREMFEANDDTRIINYLNTTVDDLLKKTSYGEQIVDYMFTSSCSMSNFKIGQYIYNNYDIKIASNALAVSFTYRDKRFEFREWLYNIISSNENKLKEMLEIAFLSACQSSVEDVKWIFSKKPDLEYKHLIYLHDTIEADNVDVLNYFFDKDSESLMSKLITNSDASIDYDTDDINDPNSGIAYDENEGMCSWPFYHAICYNSINAAKWIMSKINFNIRRHNDYIFRQIVIFGRYDPAYYHQEGSYLDMVKYLCELCPDYGYILDDEGKFVKGFIKNDFIEDIKNDDKYITASKLDYTYECPICMESDEKLVKFNCSHLYCRDCIKGTMKQSSIIKCMQCLQNIDYTKVEYVLNKN